MQAANCWQAANSISKKQPRQTGSACPHALQAAPTLATFPPPTCNFSAALCSSSLYYDEDGDLAHEFYEETVVTKNGRKKSKLKRIQKNLIPQVREGLCVVCLTSAKSVCFILQGIVKLEHPCIHVDFPMILCEV